MWYKVYDSILAQLEDETQVFRLQIVPGTLYFGEPIQNAQRLCRKANAGAWTSMGLPGIDDESAWKQLTPKEFKGRLVAAHYHVGEEQSSTCGFTMAIVCAVVLWKSGMLETRGMKFVYGVLIRKLHEMLDRPNEISEIDLENVMFVLLGIHNTGSQAPEFAQYSGPAENIYTSTYAAPPEKGSHPREMEDLILSMLIRDCIFYAGARGRAAQIANEDVNRYRGPHWSYPVISKRNPSETLAVLLRRHGDVFTSLEGGLFALSIDQQMELDEWREKQRQEWLMITRRRYTIDKDGWYYRTFGWRSLVVYIGTVGAFVVSLIVTLMDLGEEGKNVFKRINFFATLFVSMDLVILGVLKILDRNDKAVTDGIFFKRRVFDISREYSAEGYSAWRKAMAFDSSHLAGVIAPSNMCYASGIVRGTIVSPKKMRKAEVKEMFYVIEHGYHEHMKTLLNKNTGEQFTIVLASNTSSFTIPVTGVGIEFTGIVRKVRNEDKIGNLG